jgi:prophage antirepressor-like protein
LFFQVGSIYHFNLNGIILVLLIAETIKNHKRLTSLLSNEEIITQKGENMNDLQIFNNEEFGEIRTAVVNDEPMFCLIDICKALEIKNATDVAKRLDEDELTRLNLGSRAGETNFITESGLYAVILRSDKPNAKKFRKWVTAEVLPSIRKTGSYGMPKTTGGQIQLLAQGYTELEQKVNDIKDDVSELKENVPLYSCDIDEIQQHVKRRVVNILGGKQSEAYRDNSIRHKTFSDIWHLLYLLSLTHA